jgi:hypothetical protein
LITIVFKLIPFVIGVDEAGAQFVAETVAMAAGIGVTLAVIRKGRILFWTAVGLALIVKRGCRSGRCRGWRPVRNKQILCRDRGDEGDYELPPASAGGEGANNTTALAEHELPC